MSSIAEYSRIKGVNIKHNQYVFRIEDSESSRNFYIVVDDLDNEFYAYYNNAKVNSNIHEIIFRNERKLVFDVDYDYDGTLHPWTIVENIISSSISTISEYYGVQVSSNKFLIFESNGEHQQSKFKFKFKYSYHIVLDGYYFISRDETEFIYSKVLELYSSYDHILDNIYKPNQSLRLLGSTKSGTTRTKSFVDRYVLENTYISQKISDHEILLSSLVSNIHNSLLILNTKLEIRSIDSKFKEVEEETYYKDNQIYSRLIELLSNYCDTSSFRRSNVIEMGDNIHIYNLRLRKSYQCMICEREHFNQSPFLMTILKESKYCCYYKCRRYMDQVDKKYRVFIGNIKYESSESTTESDESQSDEFKPLSEAIRESRTREISFKSCRH